MSSTATDKVHNVSKPNGIAPPSYELPVPDGPDDITSNILKLNQDIPDARMKYLFDNLVRHIHAFAKETKLTTDEWDASIQYLTRVGQKCTPLRQEMILLSDVLGLSAVVDAVNNSVKDGRTESSVLGPFFTDDAPDVNTGDSIASEGKGEYMYVEGRVLSTDDTPIPGAVIETWEADENGFYDTQYDDRNAPDMRGRLRTNENGEFGYRAVVPVNYPIPGDGPVGELLLKLRRHNMRPNHLHLMVSAPGYKTLITALYPEGDPYLDSDAVFGVKKSLVVSLKTVTDNEEAKRRGFPKLGPFRLLQHDLVLAKD